MADIIIEKNGRFNVWQRSAPSKVLPWLSPLIFIASYKTREAAERAIER